MNILKKRPPTKADEHFLEGPNCFFENNTPLRGRLDGAVATSHARARTKRRRESVLPSRVDVCAYDGRVARRDSRARTR
jgi:hypothetical protein